MKNRQFLYSKHKQNKGTSDLMPLFATVTNSKSGKISILKTIFKIWKFGLNIFNDLDILVCFRYSIYLSKKENNNSHLINIKIPMLINNVIFECDTTRKAITICSVSLSQTHYKFHLLIDVRGLNRIVFREFCSSCSSSFRAFDSKQLLNEGNVRISLICSIWCYI